MDSLDVAPGHVVVDIGCGTGEMVHRLLQTCPTATVIGFDIMRELLTKGRDRSPTAGYVCARAEHLPIGPRSVDRVLIQRLLMHLPQWRKVIAEAARVLRPDGILVISEPTWSRFEFVSGSPELDAKLVAHMQQGVAVPDIGERLCEALQSENLTVTTRTWVASKRQIDVMRYGRLAVQLADEVPLHRLDRWMEGWPAPGSHTVSHVRKIVATTE
ncbi:methyltransferase domain-containing protein [Flexivirga caeni]|uniref:methyltransferase domain-containing protein n=1 Tax=Flexivirga caeni TaxID=2294115 RepID=UPI0013154CC0